MPTDQDALEMAKQAAEENADHRGCMDPCDRKRELLVAEALIRREEGVEPEVVTLAGHPVGWDCGECGMRLQTYWGYCPRGVCGTRLKWPEAATEPLSSHA